MAIKIIKQGDLNLLKRTLRFECKACGCVFDADKEDYVFQFSQRENENWYETKCPCCGKTVTRSVS